MFYCAQMMTEAVYEMTPAAVPGSGTGELPQEARQEPGSLEKYVSETIVYPGIMKGMAVPQTAAAEITCPDGTVLERTLPLTGMDYSGERWEDDLDLTLVFHRYGADGYLFGGCLVGHDDENPPLDILSGYIAEELGVSPSEIEITDSFWMGEAYTDEEGEVCRDARALGRRLVYDCSASYGAAVQIPEEPEPRTFEETEVHPAPAAEPEQDTAPDFGPAPETGRGIFRRALRWVTEHVTVTVSIFFLALLIAGFLLLKRMAGEEDRRRIRDRGRECGRSFSAAGRHLEKRGKLW